MTSTNPFLTGSLPRLFLRTAAPIALVMLVNGTFNLVDAWFLGRFVGAQALTAVTLMFPVYMLLISLAVLVSNGFGSVIARLLGAGRLDDAGAVFSNAHVLSLTMGLLMMVLFFSTAWAAVPWIAGGPGALAAMGYTYMSITIAFSPLLFLVNIQSAALRSEGKIRLMTSVSLMSVALNVLFNYVLIVKLEWGVAGSAYGSALAHAVSFITVIGFRLAGVSRVRPRFYGPGHFARNAREMLALGAPSSLGYMGVALTVAAVVYTVRLWGGANFEATVGAYGIITRLMTFSYLPLMGLGLAFQAIAGNNFGAREMARTDTSLKLAMFIAFLFCATMQAGFFTGADVIGLIFVDDAAMVAETARILPYMTLLFFVFGPLMIISNFFQAIGDAARAAILSLPRPYVFSLPLIFLLPLMFGEWGIWFAGPIAEALMLLLTATVLAHNQRRNGVRLGLFHYGAEVVRVRA